MDAKIYINQILFRILEKKLHIMHDGKVRDV